MAGGLVFKKIITVGAPGKIAGESKQVLLSEFIAPAIYGIFKDPSQMCGSGCLAAKRHGLNGHFFVEKATRERGG